MLKSLDLFTGYGGLTLALEEWCKPIAYVEIEEYAQKIIASRMADGSLPRAPILADVKNIEGEPQICDIITGGFPCQDISCAGNGVGLGGERSGLFFEIARLTKEIQPSFVFLENVPAIRTRGLYNVAEEFSSMGYDCRWTNVSANYVGAPHQRKRFFMLAHANSESVRLQSRWRRGKKGPKTTELKQPSKKKLMARTTSAGSQGWLEPQTPWEAFAKHGCAGAFEGIQGLPKPAICRDDDGTAFRVDRLKALGNGVVPAQARLAFEYLMGVIETQEEQE
jgi:DNA (cytosine-5)-methyltransferase 1